MTPTAAMLDAHPAGLGGVARDALGVLSRRTAPDPAVLRSLLEACAQACASCGAECARHAERGMEHCRVCAEECRRCEAACRELLASLS